MHIVLLLSLIEGPISQLIAHRITSHLRRIYVKTKCIQIRQLGRFENQNDKLHKENKQESGENSRRLLRGVYVIRYRPLELYPVESSRMKWMDG
jgi:hypothetical protein